MAIHINRTDVDRQILEINVGLDFGTTYSVVSHYIGNRLEDVQQSERKSSARPTIVYKKDGKTYCGHDAMFELENSASDEGVVFRAFKIALTASTEDRKKRGFNNEHTPELVTIEYINHLLESYLDKSGNNKQIDRLYVGVPLVWKEKSRTRFKIDILEKITNAIQTVIVPEPDAACAYLAYDYKENTGNDFNGRILVIDYGGGTLDIALCEVSQKNGDTQVKDLYNTGAGENHNGGQPGDAGVAYMEAVIKYIAQENNIDISDSSILDKFIYILEDLLTQDTYISKIKKAYQKNHGINGCKEDDTLLRDISITKNGKIISLPITIATLAKVYKPDDNNKWSIYRVLESKLKEMIIECDKKGYKYTPQAYSNDNLFKIARVGGFCNFHFVSKQIEEFFKIADPSIDQRLTDITNFQQNRERAISFGATLLAEGKIVFRHTAHYSLGNYQKTESEGGYLWAISKGQELDVGKRYYVNNGKPIRCTVGLANLAFNFNNDEKDATYGNVFFEKYSDINKLNGCFSIAYSIDEDDILYIHIQETDKPGANKIGDEKIVRLEQIETLVKEFQH